MTYTVIPNTFGAKGVFITVRFFHKEPLYKEPTCRKPEKELVIETYVPVIGFPGMGDPGDTGRNRNFLH